MSRHRQMRVFVCKKNGFHVWNAIITINFSQDCIFLKVFGLHFWSKALQFGSFYISYQQYMMGSSHSNRYLGHSNRYCYKIRILNLYSASARRTAVPVIPPSPPFSISRQPLILKYRDTCRSILNLYCC